MFVRELTDGCEIDQVLLVRAVEVRQKRDGKEFLRLSLGDRTGCVTAMIWDGVRELARHVNPGLPVRTIGRYADHPQYGAQITVRALRTPPPDSFEMADLFDGPPRPVADMQRDLRALVETVRDPHLARLLDGLLGETSPTWPAFRDAPAAKHYHQAYRHGLLEHSLTVAQAVHSVSGTFPGIDHDVAVTGALLHDIGKLEAYTSDGVTIEMTDAGRLHGEIPLGYALVRRAVEALPGFPPATAEAILHVILSHHGALEHGSPVVPCTREATLVHFIDNLGGRLGSFDRLEKELPDGAAWSPYDRALGAGAYFAHRAAGRRRARRLNARRAFRLAYGVWRPRSPYPEATP